MSNRQFYRQKTIGNYIVDFYCPSAKLIVEVDGGQHYTEDGKIKDKKRSQHLRDLGFTILRFNNLDGLQNIDGVVTRICQYLKFCESYESP